MKYRKKPVEIEAVQWTGRVFSEYPDWIVAAKRKHPQELGSIRFNTPPNSDIDIGEMPCYVHTLEGVHSVAIGNFVICGVKGEIYSCDPEIFQMTYEAS